MRLIDSLLNRISMYRLVLYYLVGLLGVAFALSCAGILPYDPYALLFSVGFLVGVCALTNTIFARAFGVPSNVESTYISALILALIITPIQSWSDLWFLGWAGVWAMASKYMLAINKRHIFNPIAFAVALTYFTVNQSASWWVGNALLLPFVLIGGLLLVRKVGRFDLVMSFLLVALATSVVLSVISGQSLIAAFQNSIVSSPLLFFAFVIITEPLTTPPTRGLQRWYGALVGVLFAPQFHIGSFYTTPELAVLIGNVFSYLVSSKTTLVLHLRERIQIAPDIYDFVFVPTRRLRFAPGQYMEWTLGHDDPDGRGNRRFFTLASSPTEDALRVGVKFYPQSSTFKHAMLTMDGHTEVVATHLAGDFTLPADPRQKCVFIAGGIGITPFRSMIKYLLDTHQPRPIVLFYATRRVDDMVYHDVFEQAWRELGIKTIYTITNPHQRPAWWQGQVGRITPELIQAEVPDYLDCTFYLSGPNVMVDAFKTSLAQLHVKKHRIKTDYFPGLA